jgi:hypothetical protein
MSKFLPVFIKFLELKGRYLTITQLQKKATYLHEMIAGKE